MSSSYGELVWWLQKTRSTAYAQKISQFFTLLWASKNAKIATLDFYGLTKFLIKYEYQNFSDALNQIKFSAGNETDLHTIDLCVRLYEDTLDDTGLILKVLAAKKKNLRVGDYIL